MEDKNANIVCHTAENTKINTEIIKNLSSLGLTQGNTLTQVNGNPSFNLSRDFLFKFITINKSNNGKVILKKYPGYLFISVYSLEKLKIEPGENISIQTKSSECSHITEFLPSKEFVKPNIFIKIPITENPRKPIEIDISVMIGKQKAIFSTAGLQINSNEIDLLQNNLVEKKLPLIDKGSILSSLMSKVLKMKSTPSHSICRCYCSYISQDDIDLFETQPTELINLGKYVIFRRNAFELLFSGYVHLKYENNSFIWKRYYIEWYGFTMLIFNAEKYTNRTDYTNGNANTDEDEKIVDEKAACLNSVEDYFNLFDSEPSVELLSKKILRFYKNEKYFEIECLDIDSLRKCTDAICTAFPKVLNLFN